MIRKFSKHTYSNDYCFIAKKIHFCIYFFQDDFFERIVALATKNEWKKWADSIEEGAEFRVHINDFRKTKDPYLKELIHAYDALETARKKMYKIMNLYEE